VEFRDKKFLYTIFLVLSGGKTILSLFERERMVRSVFFVKAVDDEWCVVK